MKSSDYQEKKNQAVEKIKKVLGERKKGLEKAEEFVFKLKRDINQSRKLLKIMQHDAFPESSLDDILNADI